MKIRDIITEGGRREPQPAVGNDDAIISRTTAQAVKHYDAANKGAIDMNHDVHSLLKKVRDMYGVEIVDDFKDTIERPDGEYNTDKEESLLSKDNRKS